MSVALQAFEVLTTLFGPYNLYGIQFTRNKTFRSFAAAPINPVGSAFHSCVSRWKVAESFAEAVSYNVLFSSGFRLTEGPCPQQGLPGFFGVCEA